MKKAIAMYFVGVFIFLFVSGSFAQEVPGGESGGQPDGEVSSQPSPVSFKRNNGNGTCRGEAQIRLAFEKMPKFVPVIEEIRYQGRRLEVAFGDIDASQLAKKGYVSYCIISGNIPPAGKLSIKLRYMKTNQTFWMDENKNK